MVKSVAAFLDHPENEERTVEDVAKLIVDAFYDGWSLDVSEALPAPSVGLAYRTPLTSKTYHVCWSDDVQVWLCDSSGGTGILIPIDSKFWQTCQTSRSKPIALVNENWKVGDKATRSQRMFAFTVEAVNPKGVLLRESYGTLWAEDNASMEQYYKKEQPKNDLFD
jgi:hypothetical protein